MAEKQKRLAKRTEIATFLNITPTEETEDFELAGYYQTTGEYSYDASETDETYIVDDNPTTVVEKYKVSMDNEQKCYIGDPVYDFINNLRRKRAIGSEAETTTLCVEKYDVNEEGEFYAEKSKCSISISKFGGDGGQTPMIGYKINLNGDPIYGRVKIENGKVTFKEDSMAISLKGVNQMPISEIPQDDSTGDDEFE